MSRPSPSPIFTHFGIEGGVSSIALLEYKGRHSIFVGSQNGRIVVYDAETQLEEDIFYEEPDHHSILSISQNCNDIIIHVRTIGLLKFDWRDDEYKSPTILCRTAHYGYCNATKITNGIVMPHMKGDDQHLLRIIDFQSKVLFEDIALKSKGSPMCMLSTGSSQFFIAFEEGNVQTFRNENKLAEVSLFAEPIFCMASTSIRDQRLLICGSTKTPLRMTSLTDDDIFGETIDIPYIEEALGCSALTVSPSGKTFFAGFWNGSIRAFSINKLLVVALMTWHTDTVTSLLSVDKNTLYSGGKDEKLIVWKL